MLPVILSIGEYTIPIIEIDLFHLLLHIWIIGIILKFIVLCMKQYKIEKTISRIPNSKYMPMLRNIMKKTGRPCASRSGLLLSSYIFYYFSSPCCSCLISFVRISLQTSSMKVGSGFWPSSPKKRLLTDTRPSSSSFWPTMSI